MKTIIISPYSKKLRKEKPSDPDRINPKNFPYWKEVVSMLRSKGYHTVQIGVLGEEGIGADEIKFNLKLKDLAEVLRNSHGWVCVDNFFNHFATFHKKRGVVIFGRSDPNIFGYPQNINLLKSRSYLRNNQFELWEQDEFNPDAFVSAEAVVAAILTL